MWNQPSGRPMASISARFTPSVMVALSVDATTSIQRGKYALRTMWALPTMAPTADTVASAKNVHTTMPSSSWTGKFSPALVRPRSRKTANTR